MDLKDLLKSVPLFADLSPDQILWLSERSAEVSFQPGEIVFREGAPAEFFDILIEGAVDVTWGVDMTRAVDVTRRSAGQEGPVARFDEPGAACTLVALAAGHPFVGSGRANGSTRLLRFSAETFREMLGLCPSTVPKLMEALAAPVRAEEGRGPEKTAAETVRKSEEKYRTLFEEARFAIHLADETGRIVECNRHACDLMGYTREEMLQRRVQDVTGPDFRDSVSLRMSKILEEGMPPYESKNLRKDGASIDIEVSATPVDIEGRRYVMYFLRDITEKKRAEEELRASQERFRSITESATDAIVSADETGRIFLWNHGAEKIFGRREEEVLGQPLTLLIPERLREAYGKWMSRVRETGEPRLAGRTLESFGFRKDGSEFPMELSRAVWKRGEEMFFTWIIRDTSERKQAEEALRKSEEKHRTVFEQAGDAIVIADEAGRLVDCNRHACDLVDYRREELLGMKMRDFIPPGLREGLKKRLTVIARAGRGMTPYDVQILKKDGSTVDIEASTASIEIENSKHVIYFLRDISERKRAEEKLQASEVKYRELVEQANSIILRMDTQGKITFFNEFAERFFGYSKEEILGRHVVGAIVPETDEADRDLTAMIRDIFQNPDRYIRNENENMRRNGERVWIIWDNKPIFDEDGRLTEVLCVGSDVTERRRAEEAQRRSEERYHTLFERARDAILVTAEDGRFIDCNEGACGLLGYRRKELLEMRQEDVAPPEFKDGAAQRRMQIIREEKWQKPFETRATRKDGVILDIEVSGTPIEIHGRTHVIYFVRDITERKRSERELETLRQQEKLAAIGKISSGLAHELNNPAAAAQRTAQETSAVLAAARTHAMALGRLSLTQEQMDLLLAVHERASKIQNPPGSSDPLAESAREEEIAGWLEEQGVPEAWRLGPALAHADVSVEQLQAVANGLPEETHSSAFAWLERSIVLDALVRETTVATRRISDLVNAVKSYSLMDQSSKGAMDVHQGLDDTLTLLGHKLREHKIEVVRAYDPGLRSVEANGPELNQVWTNLIDNAIDAAGPGGEIRLRTSQETDTVLVEIVDNGPGIPEEIRAKVFEPFFTTKDVGKGTGLGLQIVHRIVRETHHGEIEIDSKPGETRFRIRLPVSAGTPER